jgi:hypothetical protein
MVKPYSCLSWQSFTCQKGYDVGSIGKIKPLFTRVHPPASPRFAPVSPLDVPLSRPSPPAAGELGRRPGRPPAVRHPRRAPGRRRRPGALGLQTSGTVVMGRLPSFGTRGGASMLRGETRVAAALPAASGRGAHRSGSERRGHNRPESAPHRLRPPGGFASAFPSASSASLPRCSRCCCVSSPGTPHPARESVAPHR